jgi:hypothetical protein
MVMNWIGLILVIILGTLNWVNAVEYLQSGVTLAVHKDIAKNLTDDFWPKFKSNLIKTKFCDDGCTLDKFDTQSTSPVSNKITIYNFTFSEVSFDTKLHVMVLIESSQTIKIVIEKLFFNSTFFFKSESPVYSDQGQGYLSNNMTVTLAVSPSSCPVTGKFLAVINSVVVQNNEQYKNYFRLEADSIPMKRIAEDTEAWRKFLIENLNDVLKIFQTEIEDGFNHWWANIFYDYTNRTYDKDTPCPLKTNEDTNS